MLRQNWLSVAAVSIGLSALVLFPNQAKAQINILPRIIEAQAERGQAQGMITKKSIYLNRTLPASQSRNQSLTP